MKYLLPSILLISISGLLIPSAFAESVPSWVKNTAGWWATDAISETEFVNAVEFLVKENIIQVNVSQASETSQSVPDWVKNTAGWWAGGLIDDSTFISGIQWLISNGIITLEDECVFHGNEYDHLTGQARLVLCNPDIDLDYIHTWIKPDDSDEHKLNSEGFRGPEFSKQKPDNTYRIIAVGGSTTW